MWRGLLTAPPDPTEGLLFSRVQNLATLELTTAILYIESMTIELPDSLVDQLQSAASTQGRDIRALVEEAVRDYLEWTAVTETTGEEVGESQVAMLGELTDFGSWDDNA
ncbi:MAG: ribbon-helix-helix protein, CopG family [Candidatus Hydrogenedentes bacterium]|nr:ribbon-helix-helix protein, CopG family [Candidatus Hydrogenedentota bacterium]